MHKTFKDNLRTVILVQCNTGGDVWEHDKHAQLCKWQSFISLGLRCLTQKYSTASNSYSQFVIEMSASHHSHALLYNTSGRGNDKLPLLL